MENTSNIRKNKRSPVDKGCWGDIRIRFETLFVQYGKRRTELTHFLGCDKSKTSRIVNGQEIPNLQDRVKIAQFFGIDSSVIWENPDMEREDGN